MRLVSVGAQYLSCKLLKMMNCIVKEKNKHCRLPVSGGRKAFWGDREYLFAISEKRVFLLFRRRFVFSKRRHLERAFWLGGSAWDTCVNAGDWLIIRLQSRSSFMNKWICSPNDWGHLKATTRWSLICLSLELSCWCEKPKGDPGTMPTDEKNVTFSEISTLLAHWFT